MVTRRGRRQPADTDRLPGTIIMTIAVAARTGNLPTRLQVRPGGS